MECRFYQNPRKCVNLIFLTNFLNLLKDVKQQCEDARCRGRTRWLQHLCSGSRAGCNSSLRRGPAFAKLRRGRHVRHSDGLVPWRACHYSHSQATRLPLQSRSIDCDDFALVWPLVPGCDKSSPNWIVANIAPFLRVTFVAAQTVIKESRLPKAG